MDITFIDPGELRQQIQIQTLTEAANSFGEVTPSEPGTTIPNGTVWAKISTLTGREMYQAQRIAAEATHKVILRYLPGVTDKCRVLFGTRKFDINAVLNLDERNIELHLLCKEAV